MPATLSRARLEERLDLGPCEPREGPGLDAGAAERRERLATRVRREQRLAAMAAKQPDRQPGQTWREERERVQALGIGLVQVVDHDRQRPAARCLGEELVQVLEQAQLRRFRGGRRRRSAREAAFADRAPALGKPRLECWPQREQPADRLAPDPVGDGRWPATAADGDHRQAERPRARPQRERHVRLPDARLALEEHRPSRAVRGRAHARFERSEQGAPPHQERIIPEFGRHRSDQPIAATADRADDRLPGAVIADRAARLLDQTAQGGRGDADPGPEPLLEHRLGEELPAVPEQDHQEIQHLGLDGHLDAGAQQDSGVAAELTVGEPLAHAEHPCGAFQADGKPALAAADSPAGTSRPAGAPASVARRAYRRIEALQRFAASRGRCRMTPGRACGRG